MNECPDDQARAEEAEAALHEGLERAHELVAEARLAMRQQQARETKPKFVLK